MWKSTVILYLFIILRVMKSKFFSLPSRPFSIFSQHQWHYYIYSSNSRNQRVWWRKSCGISWPFKPHTIILFLIVLYIFWIFLSSCHLTRLLTRIFAYIFLTLSHFCGILNRSHYLSTQFFVSYGSCSPMFVWLKQHYCGMESHSVT
jgi:hypothetical protein